MADILVFGSSISEAEEKMMKRRMREAGEKLFGAVNTLKWYVKPHILIYSMTRMLIFERDTIPMRDCQEVEFPLTYIAYLASLGDRLTDGCRPEMVRTTSLFSLTEWQGC